MRAAMRTVKRGMPTKLDAGNSSAMPLPSTPSVAHAFLARVGPKSGPPCFLLPPTSVGAMSQASSRQAFAPSQPLATMRSYSASPTVGAGCKPGVGQLKNREDSICAWLGSSGVVRCMPNTPALIGQGITALFACPTVSLSDQAMVERVIGPTGAYLWVQDEAQLDAVTALSGSGPAYVFYFLEAMTAAGTQMGLSGPQAYQLAVATFSGAASLAAASSDPPQMLRQRVTSKGGTTHAAISSMDASDMHNAFVKAMKAAQSRAREMGDEFGCP